MKYFFLPAFFYFFIACLFVTGQSLTISPNVVPGGTEVELTISAKDFKFSSDTTNCPNKLKVDISTVEFQQGSGTVNYAVKPSSLTLLTSESIKATFNFLDYTQAGNLVIGANTGCPKVCPGCVSILQSPKITISPEYTASTFSDNYRVYGNMIFSDTAKTDCISKMAVDEESVYIQNDKHRIKATAVLTSEQTYFEFQTALPYAAGLQTYDVIVTSKDSVCKVMCKSCLHVIPEYTIGLQADTIERGKKMTVTIAGENFKFSQASATSCHDGNLPATVENIYFDHKNNDQYFKPSDFIFVNDTLIKVGITFPHHAIPGDYHVIIVNEACRAFSRNEIVLSNTQFNLKFSNKKFEVLDIPSFSRDYPRLEIFSSELFRANNESECPDKLQISLNDVLVKNGQWEYYNTDVRSNFQPGYNNLDFQTAFEIHPDAPDGLYDVILGVNSGCPSICRGCYERKPEPMVWDVLTPVVAKGALISVAASVVEFGKDIENVCNKYYAITDSTVRFRNITNKSLFRPDHVLAASNRFSALLPNNIAAGKYDILVGTDSDCLLECKECLTVLDSTVLPSFSILLRNDNPYVGQDIVIGAIPHGIIWTDSAMADCGRTRNVTKENVTLVSEDNNLKIIPGSISFSDDPIDQSFTAFFTIPSQAPVGKYKLVVNNQKNCTLTSLNTITLNNSSIKVTSQTSASQGERKQIDLQGLGLILTDNGDTDCKNYFNVTYGTVALVNQTSKIFADSIKLYDYNSLKNYFFIPLSADTGLYDIEFTDSLGCKTGCQSCYSINGDKFIPYVSGFNYSGAVNKYDVQLRSNVVISSSQATRCPSLNKVLKEEIVVSNGLDSLPVLNLLFSTSQNNTIQINGKIGSNKSEGFYDIILDSKSACPLVCKGCIKVIQPKLLSVSPDSGIVNERLSVTILGEGVFFGGGTPTTNFISASNVWIQKDTTRYFSNYAYSQFNNIQASFLIPENVALGLYNVHVFYQDTILTCNNCLTLKNDRYIYSYYNSYKRNSHIPVNIWAQGFVFSKTTNASCGSVINPDNVSVSYRHNGQTFQIQGIYDFYNEKSFRHDFVVPMHWPSGKYDIVMNKDSECPLVCKDCFTLACDSFPASFSGIQGSEIICSDSTLIITYSMPNIIGLKYDWSLEGGRIIENNNHSVSLTLGNNPHAYLQVTPRNQCGEWGYLSKHIQTSLEHGQASILGNPSPCLNTTQVYKIDKYTYNYNPHFEIKGGDLIKDSLDFLWINWHQQGPNAIILLDTNKCDLLNSVKFDVVPQKSTSNPKVFKLPNLQLISSEAQGNQWFKNGVLLSGDTSMVLDIIEQDRPNKYRVQVTNACGVFTSADIEAGYWVVTDINKNDQVLNNKDLFTLDLSPNPAESIVNVATNSATLEVLDHLDIIDSYGRVYQTMDLTEINQQVNTTELPAGLYIIKAYGNGKQVFKKLIIQK